jgi:hypothetical protein
MTNNFVEKVTLAVLTAHRPVLVPSIMKRPSTGRLQIRRK